MILGFSRSLRYFLAHSQMGLYGNGVSKNPMVDHDHQYRFIIPSLPAQCLVYATSARYALVASLLAQFFERKKQLLEKNQPAKCIPLSQLGVRHHPAQLILRIRQTLSHSFASSP